MRHLRRFLTDTAAATSVEYAVMLALIFAAVVASITLVGFETNSSFSKSNQNLNTHGFGS